MCKCFVLNFAAHTHTHTHTHTHNPPPPHTNIHTHTLLSGHGLSGLALLSLASYVAVPAMFAGGIGLAIAGKILL